MQITTKTSHEITFTVSYFESEEGGMGSEDFGEQADSLEEAIFTLNLAKASRPEHEWVIVAVVKTTVTSP